VWYAWAMSASSEETVTLLGQVPVFSALSPEELEQVARVALPRRFEAGEVVFKEGDEGSTCYIVRSGRARAVREHPDGRSITLAHFAPGDIFGEMSMFDGERRSATVETTEGTEAIAILSADMHRLLREHPDISVKLIAALGQRLRDTNERLARQSFQTVQSRVAAVLAQLVESARSEGDEVGEGDVLITTTQAELAQLAGSSRESASRFLAVLERAGIITQGRGRLTVHDAQALRRYVY
jgi:CRP/FNR family transcriptional regulator, cyclic AMP receptor protein